MTNQPTRPRILIGPEHGEAWAAGLRVCAALRRGMEQFRGKDAGIDAILAACDQPRETDVQADKDAA